MGECKSCRSAKGHAELGGGRSYPTRIVGGSESAIVAFIDTPELFGDEIHGLGAVDIQDGKVVRWVDYWDATTFDREIFSQMASPNEDYPADFHADTLKDESVGTVRQVVAELHTAMGGSDGEAAAPLFTFSAHFEDLALRTLITGRAAIGRYIARMADAPYGADSKVRHVLGGTTGGGMNGRPANRRTCAQGSRRSNWTSGTGYRD